MKVRALLCDVCRKDVVAGQLLNKITWRRLTGGGDDIETVGMIVHRLVCLAKAKEQAFKDEHPYGPDGVDLGAEQQIV